MTNSSIAINAIKMLLTFCLKWDSLAYKKLTMIHYDDERRIILMTSIYDPS